MHAGEGGGGADRLVQLARVKLAGPVRVVLPEDLQHAGPSLGGLHKGPVVSASQRGRARHGMETDGDGQTKSETEMETETTDDGRRHRRE